VKRDEAGAAAITGGEYEISLGIPRSDQSRERAGLLHGPPSAQHFPRAETRPPSPSPSHSASTRRRDRISHHLSAFSLPLGFPPPRHISDQTEHHLPAAPHHGFAKGHAPPRPQYVVGRLALQVPWLASYHPHASSSSDTSRANSTLQLCRMPNRQRTNRMATWRVSNMCCCDYAVLRC
jgi:hypothetical protein